MFTRILVANRGEIALRVIRACRDMGIEAIAVFSRADRDAAYLNLAHDAICIGPESAQQSYLNAAALLSAAELADVQAIHPGYGFLAENPKFAQMCRDCKIEFIGPSAEAMQKLGDKVQARKLAREAKVPLVPGSPGTVDSEDDAITLAGKIGYPVMIKAVAGGGGRGIVAPPALDHRTVLSVGQAVLMLRMSAASCAKISPAGSEARTPRTAAQLASMFAVITHSVLLAAHSF